MCIVDLVIKMKKCRRRDGGLVVSLLAFYPEFECRRSQQIFSVK